MSEVKTCTEAWKHMSKISADKPVRNFCQTLDMSDYLVITDMFPQEALEAYSNKNLEKEILEEHKKYFNDQRGGGQGDYREGMAKKIANVVECINNYPNSKRALITICNNSTPSHTFDEDAKCMREIHFHVDDENKLNGTVLFRAQAAQIFPKNIHYVGKLMDEVAQGLEVKPSLGTLFYIATILVSDRS